AGRAAGFVSANRDITLRKLAEEKLQQAKDAVEVAYAELEHALAREQLLARTDSLTNLFNRRHFFLLADHEFSVAMRYEQPVSAIIFDVDHFKNVNDRWGHYVGDDVLRHVSRIAQKQVRAADILARYGGEEFIILLPNSSAAEAANVAERIRRKVLAYRIDPEHTQAGITVSVGVAEKDARVQTLDDLIRRADHALYAAKGAGRNCVKIYQASV
ncbi:MAG: GGDEF domain-containing protein, partial [Chloroflexi bacterium]